MVEIREARPDDAERACEVLRRSIAELCDADHRGDAARIAAWLANKTAANVRGWIDAPGSHVFVACEGETIVGVAALTSTGLLTLNYVTPEKRFRGVSKALLARLEEQARMLGVEECTLTSTETARRFYRSAGYVEQDSSVVGAEGIPGYPMTKRLVG